MSVFVALSRHIGHFILVAYSGERRVASLCFPVSGELPHLERRVASVLWLPFANPPTRTGRFRRLVYVNDGR